MVESTKEIAVKIANVSKDFKLPNDSQNSLKGRLINFNKRGYEVQHALKDISIDVNKGDFLGIVGRNGSGKSTLLKLISGIYSPNKGSINVNGKLTPFIELGVGFNPELSGRDNVFLNGALLGFNRQEMTAMYDEIVAFAEIERFMDQKLKNYSSGMQIRLAFSIAIRANTEILVLDEVLAVGDEAFQRKCYAYFSKLKDTGKTVILVTHDMNAVKRFCTRAVVLNDGKVLYDGDTQTASETYRELNLQGIKKSLQTNNAKKTESLVSERSEDCVIEELAAFDEDHQYKVFYKPNEPINLFCKVKINKDDVDNIELLIKLNNPGGTIISALEFMLDEHKKGKFKKGDAVTIKWELPGIYNDGTYVVSGSLKNKETEDFYVIQDDIYEFNIEGWDMPNVLVHPRNKYSVKVEGEI